MQRFVFERAYDDRSFEIYDGKQGQFHKRDRIATVYDVVLAQKIVDMLNDDPQYHLCFS